MGATLPTPPWPTYRGYRMPYPPEPGASDQAMEEYHREVEDREEEIDTLIRRGRLWFRFVRWLLRKQALRQERGIIA